MARTVKRIESRGEVVARLIELMSDSTKEMDCEAIELLSAFLSMTQHTITFILKRSKDEQARIENQRTILNALEACMLACAGTGKNERLM
jgi:dsDNA-binding SOS-regulon protein